MPRGPEVVSGPPCCRDLLSGKASARPRQARLPPRGPRVQILPLSIEDEAAVVGALLPAMALRAALRPAEFVDALVEPVGRNQVAQLAARHGAETVDLSLEIGLHLEDRVAQRVTLDEIVRELVERPVKIVVDADIFLVGADHDLPVEAMIPIEHETRALSDQDAVAERRGEESVRDGRRFVEDEQEVVQRGVIDEEKADAGVVEDRADEGLMWRERPRRRLHAGKVVELEHDALVFEGDPVAQARDPFDRDTVRSIESPEFSRRVLAPAGRVFIIIELDLALIAIA